MFCPHCGAKVEEGMMFCPTCGKSTAAVPAAAPVSTAPAAPAPEPVRSAPAAPAAPAPAPSQPAAQSEQIRIPIQYKPIGPWGYFGLSFLFAIPVIGFIFLLIFTFNKKNINRRNFARSYWCALLVLIILFLVCFTVAAATGNLDEAIRILQSYLPSF